MEIKAIIKVPRRIIPDNFPLLLNDVQSATKDILLGNPNPRDIPNSKLNVEAKSSPRKKPRKIVGTIPKTIDENSNFLRFFLSLMKLCD